MYDYDPEMPSNSILEDLFFKIFLGHTPSLPSISMLCMLIVLRTITCIITTDHPKIFLHTALKLVGLTTEKLLPRALSPYQKPVLTDAVYPLNSLNH